MINYFSRSINILLLFLVPLIIGQEISKEMSDNYDKMINNHSCSKVFSDVICGKEYYRTETVNCPLCGQKHNSHQIGVQFGMKVMVAECPTCRLAYQTPRPTVEACQAYMDMRWSSGDSYVRDSKEQKNRAKKQMQYVKQITSKVGRLLDFGAGIGTFVQTAMTEGWQAIGVERSSLAISRAKKENKVELYQEVRDTNYDVITLWDVVEHLQYPQEIFTKLRGLLRPGGYLIVETVNWESWLRLALGDEWNLYLFDHHFYFSPSSLKEMLARCGLHNFTLLNTEPTPPIIRAFLHFGFSRSTWQGYRHAKKLWPTHYSYNVMVAAVQSSCCKAIK